MKHNKRLRKAVTILLAAITAVMTLGAQAGAIVYKMDPYDMGLIQSDRRLWQLRFYIDDGLTLYDYGIDVEKIASVGFNVSACDENGKVINDYENNYGGYIFTSCNGGELTREETRARNWVSYFWNGMGGSYVTEGEEITDTITAPVTDNGDGTWTIKADINDGTGFSSLGTICQFGIGCSYMSVYIRVNTATLYDASGKIMLQFDGSGKPLVGSRITAEAVATTEAVTATEATTTEITTTEAATTTEETATTEVTTTEATTTTEDTTSEETTEAEETTVETETVTSEATETTTTVEAAEAAATTVSESKADTSADTTAAVSSTYSADFNSRNTSLYIIAAIVILIIVGVVAFVIFNKFVHK